jgi:hypothetical protein
LVDWLYHIILIKRRPHVTPFGDNLLCPADPGFPDRLAFGTGIGPPIGMLGVPRAGAARCERRQAQGHGDEGSGTHHHT